MDDLIARLRAMTPNGRSIVCNGRTTRDMSNDITEAADELTALREALAEIEHAESVQIARRIARVTLAK